MSQVRQNLRHYYDSSEEDSHPHRSLIIHGEPALKGRFPYFVMVGDNCGGSLIAPDIVLTAGHCLPPHTIQSVLAAKQRHHHHGHKNQTATNTTAPFQQEPQQLDEADYDALDWVRVGAESRYHPKHPNNNNNEDDFSTGEFFWIQRATRHTQYHRYGDDEFIYDYSILQLNGTSSLPVVHLWRNTSNTDDTDIAMTTRTIPPIVTAIGMGWTHPDRPSKAHFLQQVDLHTVSHQDCANVTTAASTTIWKDDEDDIDEEVESYEGRIDATSHLCTFEPGKDSCAYDSGSPLIIMTTPQGGDDMLVAQVSWGMECADPLFPAVNAKLTDPAILAWIHEKVCDWSVDVPSAFECHIVDGDTTTTTTTVTIPTGSIPLLGNFDFIYLLLACILAACGSRMYWGRQRKRQGYIKL